MHPWHDIPLGRRFPHTAPAVIEIPEKASAQFKLDAGTGLLRLGEFLVSPARYPANYGFFPRTLAADGDALDVFVFGRGPLPPLTLLDVRPIGGLTTLSPEKGEEHKLVAVSPGDPEFGHARTLRDLPKYRLDELRQFLEDYKALGGDKKRVKRVFPRARAFALLEKCAADYDRDRGLGRLRGAA